MLLPLLRQRKARTNLFFQASSGISFKRKIKLVSCVMGNLPDSLGSNELE